MAQFFGPIAQSTRLHAFYGSGGGLDGLAALYDQLQDYQPYK